MKRREFLVSTHLLLVDGENILLYLRKGGNQNKKYNLIAGHLDWWETPREAIIREAKEEAWIDIKIGDLEYSHVTHSIVSDELEYIQFYFSCKKWKWKISNLEKNRCYEMDFFPIKKLPINTTEYIKKAITNYLKNNIYTEDRD